MIAARRLVAQQIAKPRFASPAALISWLGAVQAQDYAGVKWAVALRLADPAATDAAIERAIDQGSIIRTHAMRWTWQLIAPADVRWILSLITPRLIARTAPRFRRLQLDPKTLRRSAKLLERALGGGDHLTRTELATALQRGGVPADGQRLAHILGHAELDQLICNGARRGKQATYALLDQRVPGASVTDPRDELVRRLAARYFTSRGPATIQDFVWWSGATVAETRAALASLETLVQREIDGRPYWGPELAAYRSRLAVLLPSFDEYLVAYRDRSAVLDPTLTRKLNAGGGLLNPCVVVDGRVVATWRRTLARDEVAIQIDPFSSLPAGDRQAVMAAARRYARFLGLGPLIKIGKT